MCNMFYMKPNQLNYAKRDVCTHCAEGPAGATLLLILDFSHISLIPPVNTVWQIKSFRQSEKSRASLRQRSVEETKGTLENQASVLFIFLIKRGRSIIY